VVEGASLESWYKMCARLRLWAYKLSFYWQSRQLCRSRIEGLWHS